MEVVEKRNESTVVLELNGRLDTNTTPVLEKKVLELLEAEEVNLVFDFGNLDYINSSGLRVLVMALQRTRGTGRKVAVCALRDYIQEIFDISGYDRLFSLFPSQAEAVAAM